MRLFDLAGLENSSLVYRYGHRTCDGAPSPVQTYEGQRTAVHPTDKPYGRPSPVRLLDLQGPENSSLAYRHRACDVAPSPVILPKLPGPENGSI